MGPAFINAPLNASEQGSTGYALAIVANATSLLQAGNTPVGRRGGIATNNYQVAIVLTRQIGQRSGFGKTHLGKIAAPVECPCKQERTESTRG